MSTVLDRWSGKVSEEVTFERRSEWGGTTVARSGVWSWAEGRVLQAGRINNAKPLILE